MIGSRWNSLQKCCLFMPVLCMSNLPRPQQTVPSGTHFNHTYHCYTALQNHFTEPVAPFWSPGLTPQNSSLLGYLKDRVYRKKPHITEALKANIWLEITNTDNNVLLRRVDNMQRCPLMCLSGGWQPFSTLDVKSSSSAWIYICMCHISFISLHACVTEVNVSTAWALYMNHPVCVFFLKFTVENICPYTTWWYELCNYKIRYCYEL